MSEMKKGKMGTLQFLGGAPNKKRGILSNCASYIRLVKCKLSTLFGLIFLYKNHINDCKNEKIKSIRSTNMV